MTCGASDRMRVWSHGFLIRSDADRHIEGRASRANRPARAGGALLDLAVVDVLPDAGGLSILKVSPLIRASASSGPCSRRQVAILRRWMSFGELLTIYPARRSVVSQWALGGLRGLLCAHDL